MTEDPDPARIPLRPHLSGLAAGALMAQGLEASRMDMPWPDGYERIGLLGVGGMGEVYLARDLQLGRDVAIKLVLPDLRGEPMILSRLQREARLMSALDHPGIVTVQRFVPLGEDGAAIVMEYVEGGNLRDLIRKHGKQFPIPDALHIAWETAAAIHAAHQNGVVHRDLKPENILLTTQQHIKVTDFGLAAPMDPLASRITMAGTTTGTADYMAPERHSGEDAGPPGDVYALGVILYEMLTGVLPRGHFDPPHTLRKEIPKPVSDAVMQALKSDPAQRPASMAALAEALHAGSAKRPKRRIVATFATCVVMLVATVVAPRFFPDGKLPAAPTSPSSPTPAASTTAPAADAPAWRDLLSAVDPARQTISGSWRTTPDGLVSDHQISILRLAAEMPESYEVRTTFTRLEGRHSIALFFRGPGGVASVDIDGWGKGLSGVQSVDGQDLQTRSSFIHFLQNQRPCELRILVRPKQVTVFVDGVNRYTSSIVGALGVVSPWQWTPDQGVALAIGSYQSPTRFTSLEWRPVGSDGISQ